MLAQSMSRFEDKNDSNSDERKESNGTGSTTQTGSNGVLINFNDLHKNNENSDERGIRKTWAAVLKDCHAADLHMKGIITKQDFMSALNNGELSLSMSHKHKEDLAVKYMIPGSEMVDYLRCFKTHLNQAASKFIPSTTEHLVSDSYKTQPNIKLMHKGTASVHPWHFDYKRYVYVCLYIYVYLYVYVCK
jgi:hypothetical protein